VAVDPDVLLSKLSLLIDPGPTLALEHRASFLHSIPGATARAYTLLLVLHGNTSSGGAAPLVTYFETPQGASITSHFLVPGHVHSTPLENYGCSTATEVEQPSGQVRRFDPSWADGMA